MMSLMMMMTLKNKKMKGKTFSSKNILFTFKNRFIIHTYIVSCMPRIEFIYILIIYINCIHVKLLAVCYTV